MMGIGSFQPPSCINTSYSSCTVDSPDITKVSGSYQDSRGRKYNVHTFSETLSSDIGILALFIGSKKSTASKLNSQSYSHDNSIRTCEVTDMINRDRQRRLALRALHALLANKDSGRGFVGRSSFAYAFLIETSLRRGEVACRCCAVCRITTRATRAS